MRTRFTFILAAAFIICAFGSPALAQTPATPSVQAAVPDAARVEAFIKTLSDAITIDNHLKVASLVKYPLEAWVDGEAITVRNDSELLARYRQIFDKSFRESLAASRSGAPSANEQGVRACGGRLLLRQVSEKNTSLKIVKIGEPTSVR